MSGFEMPKAYDFSAVEEKIYKWWEEEGWFKPEVHPSTAKPYVISIPPANVTGELHQGHALFVALEDLMIRHARMNGRAALWVPGTDHAGIATQLQVEKQIKQDEGIGREELGREEFIKRTWAWKIKYGSYITQQLRRLGASCDWDRERFTLDNGLSVAVREAFVRLYRLGLIYQGEYLVNWSPGLQTAVSDLEVEYSEEPGQLYFFNYPVVGGEQIPVATTRPETILGDTALAVHPDDERFREYVGKIAQVPIIGRNIPIIADDYVDMNFGTGALKVTPGHDPDDFDIGRRHNLEIVNVMNKDGTMSSAAGKYEGSDRFECRERLWQDMTEAGLTIKTESYVINVPRSQRGGEIIEPLVSKQWFVNVEPMAKMALAAVSSGRINIVPERFTKVWSNWLENIQPWCISRQLWWGHRIPVWSCNNCGSLTVSVQDPDHCHNCNSEDILQDPDVLDTWFSSALWPFSTLGWPEDTPDLNRYYPTDVLETGYDILFFWVARMVMVAAMFTNDIPFHTVYLHGLVRDEKGRKMSKSTGNVVDPLEIMEKFGTDALRFTLLTGGTPGNDLNLSLDKVASNRNFSNKIWNITRFIVQNISDFEDNESTYSIESNPHTLADKWIINRLSELTENTDRLFSSYQFGEAGRQIHDFLWNDFADWYIELSKVQINQDQYSAARTLQLLIQVMDHCLRLLHPFIPFVTEETWQQLKEACESAGYSWLNTGKWPEALIIAEWPKSVGKYSEESASFERLRELVRGIRALRAEYNVEPSRYVSAYIAAGDASNELESQRNVLAFLARLDKNNLQIQEELAPPDASVTISQGDLTAYLPLADLIDVDKERTRLSNDLKSVEEQISRLTKLLGSEFTNKAPEEVVNREKEKLARMQAGQAELLQRLSVLK
jgi:valyl-tRNA synthetase